MAKKTKIDGIQLSIFIINTLIVLLAITLGVLIFLYMTGRLEKPDVGNLGQESKTSAVMTTTAVTTGTPAEKTTPEDTTEEPEEEELIVTTGDETDTTNGIPLPEDYYDEEFFKNDLFIGDSIYTGLVSYEYLSDSQVFAQIGLNPESARTKEYGGYTAVTKAAELKPKRIYIMLGSNGIAFMSNTHMTEQMKLLTTEIKEKCPDSFIYIVSITPVTKAHDAEGQETMTMINGYNKMLKEMAQETGVVYLDLCSQLKDENGFFSAEYAEADGLHFLGKTYKKMLSFFQKTIQG